MTAKSSDLFARRQQRVRYRSSRRRQAAGRGSRCSARRKHIYAQVIDDAQGRTLAAASSLDKDAARGAQDRRRQGSRGRGRQAVAERAEAAGVKEVVFDRGGYLFHGRVKALADAAREGGLTSRKDQAQRGIGT